MREKGERGPISMLIRSPCGRLDPPADTAVALDFLPPIDEDPFDRIPVAQSSAGGVTLLPTGPLAAQYPAPVLRHVRFGSPAPACPRRAPGPVQP